jgi:hypothetical protein
VEEQGDGSGFLVEDKQKDNAEVNPIPLGRMKGRKLESFPRPGKDVREIKTSTVMFIPSNKGGLLKSKLREKEDEMVRITRFRVKFQEAGGVKLARMFSTELATGTHCGRLECQPCADKPEGRLTCKKQSILYESACKLCNQEDPTIRKKDQRPREGIYVGETSRSLYERTKEHFGDKEAFKPGSHMVKHWMTSHAEDPECPAFRFFILGTFSDCLSRQVAEALRIQNSKDSLLNSKNEYASNCLSRLFVDLDKFERKKFEKREEEKEKKEYIKQSIGQAGGTGTFCKKTKAGTSFGRGR